MSLFVQKAVYLAKVAEKHSPKGTRSLISHFALPIIALVGIGVYAHLQKTTMLGVLTQVLFNFEMTRIKMAACAATSVFLAIFSTQDSLLGRVSKSGLRSLGFLFYFYGAGRALLLHISNNQSGVECLFAIGIGVFSTARPFLAHLISSLFFKALISLGFKNEMIYECLADLFQKQGDCQKAFECYFLAYFATNCQGSKIRLDEKLCSLAVALKDVSPGPPSYSKRAFDFLLFMKRMDFGAEEVLFYLNKESMPPQLAEQMDLRKKSLMGAINMATVWTHVSKGNVMQFVRNPDHQAVVKFLVASTFYQVSQNLKKEAEVPEGARRVLVLPFLGEHASAYESRLTEQQGHPLQQGIDSLCGLIRLVSEFSILASLPFSFPYVSASLKTELEVFSRDVLLSRCERAIDLFLKQSPLPIEDLRRLIVALKDCKVSKIKLVLKRVLERYCKRSKLLPQPECSEQGKLLFRACFPPDLYRQEPFFVAFYNQQQEPPRIREEFTERQRLIWKCVSDMISAQEDREDREDREIRRIIIS